MGHFLIPTHPSSRASAPASVNAQRAGTVLPLVPPLKHSAGGVRDLGDIYCDEPKAVFPWFPAIRNSPDRMLDPFKEGDLACLIVLGGLVFATRLLVALFLFKISRAKTDLITS